MTYGLILRTKYNSLLKVALDGYYKYIEDAPTLLTDAWVLERTEDAGNNTLILFGLWTLSSLVYLTHLFMCYEESKDYDNLA